MCIQKRVVHIVPTINIYTMPNAGESIQSLSGMLQSPSIGLSCVCIQKRVVHIVPMVNTYTMPDIGESIESLSDALQSCSFRLSRVCIQKRVIHIVPMINIYNAWCWWKHSEQKYAKLLSYLWCFIRGKEASLKPNSLSRGKAGSGPWPPNHLIRACRQHKSIASKHKKQTPWKTKQCT